MFKNILPPDCFGNISSKISYFDQLQCWLHKPIDRKTQALLQQHCGKKLYVRNRPARFHPYYRQRVHLRQPREQALRWLAERDDCLINRIEIAIDYILEGAPREDLFDVLDRCLARRWHHGTKQHIRRPGARYDAAPSAANKIVFYSENHSRITGELNCLHMEWRLNGLKAVRSAGITSGVDLLQFDHHAFWKKRLLLYAVDCERLGHLLRNQASGQRRRKAAAKMMEWKNGSFTYRINPDARLGEIHMRSHDTVQELIDALKSRHIQPALIPIPHEALLPDPSRHFI